MEEWVLDFVLKPILWCTTISATKKAAEKLFREVCEILEAKGSIAYEVPAYREYLAIALSGANVDRMLNSDCFREANLHLMKAIENHHRTEGF
jgi:hypothetical protein